MSAILPYLERKPSERGKKDSIEDMDIIVHEEDINSSSDLAGLGKVSKVSPHGEPLDALQKSHTELTRLLWSRTLVAKALVGAKFSLELAGDGTMMVRVSPAVAKAVIPWEHAASPLKRWSLFSENSKMTTPTWDLPAGIGNLGGSCPGAAFAQSTIPATPALLPSITDPAAPNYGEITMSKQFSARLDHLLQEVQKDWASLPAKERPAQVLNLTTTVCQKCYASGNRYAGAVVQFSEVARLALVQGMLRTPQGTETLTNLLVRTLEETKLPWRKADVAKHGIRPVRVHSSGDFFSLKYAEMWLEVARRLHRNALDAAASGDTEYKPVVLWAPTRTHVLAQWADFWKQQDIPPNFVIRPSGYSAGDPAPFHAAKKRTTSRGFMQLVEWQKLVNAERSAPNDLKQRVSPTGSAGTAVLFPADVEARLVDPKLVARGGPAFGDGTKFDYQCGVYALEAGAKSCMQATAPDGSKGCRACWRFPEMSISYALH